MRDKWLTVLAVSLGLIAWAIVLSQRINPATDLRALQAPPTARTVVAQPMLAPERLYATSCASCHQSQGEGRHPVFPPLAGSPWVTGDADRLIALTLHGVSGPIEVNDVHYSGLMPGFSHLSDAELASLLTHMRASWGNRAKGVTEADVRAVRRQTAARRTPWTSDELRTKGRGGI